MCANLFYKIRLIAVFIFVLLSGLFSAQELRKEETPNSDAATITIAGDVVIYSKDAAFNEQILKNKGLQEFSKIEIDGNNELKIVAKVNKKPSEESELRKKPESAVLAVKKNKTDKSADLPQKKIEIEIKNKDIANQFLLDASFGSISFISPSNDSQLSNLFINYTDYAEYRFVNFEYKTNYFYQNNNSKLQIFHSCFSVRPPPYLI